MKRFLCLLLVALMLVPGALAEPKITYKTDKFFLQLSSDWVEVPVSDGAKTYARVTNGKYDMAKGYLMLMEIEDSKVNKKNAASAEAQYLELYTSLYQLTGKMELIATETIKVNGKDKDVYFLNLKEGKENMEYMYMAFVGGDGMMLLIMYGNEDAKNPKEELADILSAIVVR